MKQRKRIGFSYRRILLIVLPLLLLMLSWDSVRAENVGTCVHIHGYWTDWVQRNGDYSRELDYSARKNDATETFMGMEFRQKGADPWQWCFRFYVDNYIKPDKSTRKQHLKSNEWYVYTGTVEYYVTDDYPTIEEVLDTFRFPIIPASGDFGWGYSKIKYDRPRVKRTAKATIKIAPHKDMPECFNIYFDNIGIGLSFNPLLFPEMYFIK